MTATKLKVGDRVTVKQWREADAVGVVAYVQPAGKAYRSRRTNLSRVTVRTDDGQTIHANPLNVSPSED